MPNIVKEVQIQKTVQSYQTKKMPPSRWRKAAILTAIALLFGAACFFLLKEEPIPETQDFFPETDPLPAFITQNLIRVDGASRRGVKLEAVRDIAVHYVGNPGTGALANRNYFDSPDSTTSSHFIVGLEGEVILCVPLDEKSSATNERNRDTISVEVCHPDESGEFSEVTRQSLVRLLAWLCEKYDLNETNLIRHFDVTGKLCPLYYVENQEAWEALKNDVKKALEAEMQRETID